MPLTDKTILAQARRCLAIEREALEATSEGLRAEHVPVPYDHARLATEMQAEELPGEFVETILTGWWTTCLEILPARERGLGRH